MKTLTAMFTKLYNEFNAYFVDMLNLFCLENDEDKMENNTTITVSNRYNFKAYNTSTLAMG